ncbi:MAG: T9SS type A sorting domain-containing protein [Candidatus Neomarinimicrobiota bacterium]|nr:T9SS type A sorting domain-containing protein [Candidatus Neomarinimicrobiota bacterium]|tara:strand:+ start:300 stop:1058 length:759 start_codon:yes stop_codon:yes gene_type:complete
MKRYLLLFTILSNAFCIECFEETGWCYNQSVNFAFYIFEEVSINDTELNRGILEYDGTVSCPNNDCDIVGAFNGDICVGWSIYYINEELDNRFTLPVNGYDGNEYSSGYLLNGDIPTFKIFDASNNHIFEGYSAIDIPMFENFGGFIMENLYSSIDLNISNLKSNDFDLLGIYPNPFNSRTNIVFRNESNTDIKINLFDLNGKQIQSIFSGKITNSIQSINLNSENLTSGVYIMQFNLSNNNKKYVKLTHLK